VGNRGLNLENHDASCADDVAHQMVALDDRSRLFREQVRALGRGEETIAYPLGRICYQEATSTATSLRLVVGATSSARGRNWRGVDIILHTQASYHASRPKLTNVVVIYDTCIDSIHCYRSTRTLCTTFKDCARS
jgi:hypothetical protein